MTKQLDWSFAGPNAILQYDDKSSIVFPTKKKVSLPDGADVVERGSAPLQLPDFIE